MSNLDRLEAMLEAYEAGEGFDGACCHEIPEIVLDVVPALIAMAREAVACESCRRAHPLQDEPPEDVVEWSGFTHVVAGDGCWPCEKTPAEHALDAALAEVLGD